MTGFEFFRNIGIGQYVPTNSFVHKLNSKTKYLWLLSFIIVATLSTNIYILIIAAVIPILFAFVAKIKISFLLKGIVPVLPFFIFAALIQIFINWPNDSSYVIFDFWIVSLTVNELLSILKMALRFLSLMAALVLFTSVTTESETISGIEELLMPFSKKNSAVRSFALIISIVFRFVPIVSSEFETVTKAQAARGADFGTNKKNIIQKIKSYLPLVVPIIVRSLETANTLAEAMEARCFNSGVSTHYKKFENSKYNFPISMLSIVYLIMCCVFSFIF